DQSGYSGDSLSNGPRIRDSAVRASSSNRVSHFNMPVPSGDRIGQRQDRDTCRIPKLAPALWACRDRATLASSRPDLMFFQFDFEPDSEERDLQHDQALLRLQPADDAFATVQRAADDADDIARPAKHALLHEPAIPQ